MTDRSFIKSAKGQGAAPRAGRRRDAGARADRVLDAALMLFSEKGVSATRIDEIARAASIGKGTVYLYFASKEDIFRALVRRSIVPVVEGLEQRAAAPGRPAADVLRGLIADVARAMADPRIAALPKLIIAESRNFPDLARFYLETVIHRALGAVAAVLARGAAAGEFRAIDVDDTAKLCFAPLLFMLLWRHAFEPHEAEALDAGRFVAAHLETLLHGIAAPEAPCRDGS